MVTRLLKKLTQSGNRVWIRAWMTAMFPKHSSRFGGVFSNTTNSRMVDYERRNRSPHRNQETSAIQSSEPLAVRLIKDELSRLTGEHARVQTILARLYAMPGIDAYMVSQIGQTFDIVITVDDQTYFAPIHLA